jgi:catechol 2,3-dioxygenase-like lactoylglutathione lyase family enzyme
LTGAPEAVMAIQRVTHVGVCVSDMERSIRFYRDLLGFQYLSRIHLVGEPSDTLLALKGTDVHSAFLERDGVRLELIWFVSPVASPFEPPRRMNHLGFTHLSLRVTELDEMVERLRAQGVRVLDHTRIDIPVRGSAAVMITDPDGLWIELVQSRSDPALPPQV